jgi:uncharacterized protein YjlB
MEDARPKEYYFEDDGVIPNSKYPLLIYRDVLPIEGSKGGDWFEEEFADNNWTNSWRWGVYPFVHYHSNTHEVLGVFSGSALLQLGGDQGKEVTVKAGDVIVIPAGVGHKCISHSPDFNVVGAYPDGRDPDMNRGKGERPEVDRNIMEVPVPDADPLLGRDAGLKRIWK